jgi:AcrR family transcriptional regulator
MRYKAGHKEEARARMIAAASRGFRKRGFGGIGVDGLAKEAEVTSGAFYSHFPSKEAAFKEAVVAGMDQVRTAIMSARETYGAAWIELFIDFYLSRMRVCDPGDTCPLQSYSPEVARSGSETRAAYEAGMLKVTEAVAEGLEGGTLPERKQRAWALLSILSGGVTLARAVADEGVSSGIADAVRSAALQAAGPASTGSASAPV